MRKAKSRLEQPSTESKKTLAIQSKPINRDFQSSSTPRDKSRRKRDVGFNFSILLNYLHHLPTLVVSLALYGLLYYLMQRIRPSQIKNFLVPNSYLPFHGLLFLANLLFFSFLTLNTRRGLLISLLLSSLLFLKLQAVIISWQLVGGILIFFVIIELIFSWWKP